MGVVDVDAADIVATDTKPRPAPILPFVHQQVSDLQRLPAAKVAPLQHECAFVVAAK